jgi:hypothetical protein
VDQTDVFPIRHKSRQ